MPADFFSTHEMSSLWVGTVVVKLALSMCAQLSVPLHNSTCRFFFFFG